MDNPVTWPFVALWRLVGIMLELTGRFVAVVIGIVLIAVGAILAATVIGTVIGVPLMAVGLLLLVRGLF